MAASGSRLLSSNRAGWAMAAPAVGLILLFIILPFALAFGLSFTNQRLFSPNPTAVGRHRQLQAAARRGRADARAGARRRRRGRARRRRPARPIRGCAATPATTRTIRTCRGCRSGSASSAARSRTYVLASDVVFMKALRNTFVFVLCVAPRAGRAGAAAGADGQPEAPGHQLLPRRLLHAGRGLDRRGLAALALHLRRRQRPAEQRALLGDLRRLPARRLARQRLDGAAARSSPCRSGRRWAFTW